MADGFYRVMLTEGCDGHNWTVLSAAVPPGATSSSLFGVSCTGGIRCMAVGSYYSAAVGDVVDLAETWNGSTWQLTKTPKGPPISMRTGAMVPGQALESMGMTDDPGPWLNAQASVSVCPAADQLGPGGRAGLSRLRQCFVAGS
jgi:hypothetical protein